MAARGRSSGGGATSAGLFPAYEVTSVASSPAQPRQQREVTAKVGQRAPYSQGPSARNPSKRTGEVTAKVGSAAGSRPGRGGRGAGRGAGTAGQGARVTSASSAGSTTVTKKVQPMDRQMGRDKTVSSMASKGAAKKAPAGASVNKSAMKPSARLDSHMKKRDPFSTNQRSKTHFAREYEAGNVPCRLQHGSVKHTLVWDVDPEELSYDPLLITCAEGLSDSTHPHVFISRTAFKELLMAELAYEKTVPVVRRLTAPLKAALSSPSDDVFLAGLSALHQLSECVGDAANTCLPQLLVPINKKASAKATREQVHDTLCALEMNGGPDAARAIKARVPTYASV